jgi:MOSC domain-containing protein YiiM
MLWFPFFRDLSHFMQGHIFSLQRSNGGVPKLAVHQADVGPLGMAGDKQNDRRHHGGPERALCLYSLETILALQSEGHPIFPGSVGENVTIAGLDWQALQLGDRLHLGDDVVVEITSYTVPCKNIAASFSDGVFTRIGQKQYPGWSRLYARIVQGGTLQVGQAVRVVGNGA